MAGLYSTTPTAFSAEAQRAAFPQGLPAHPEGPGFPPMALDAARTCLADLAFESWAEPVMAEPDVPLRCRLGFHRWLPLALSVHGRGIGAGAGLSVSFCRSCPAVRRPASLGAPQNRNAGRP